MFHVINLIFPRGKIKLFIKNMDILLKNGNFYEYIPHKKTSPR